MKVHFLIESEQESAEREAVIVDKLYRGVDESAPTDIVRVPIRHDRIPRDSTFNEHIVFCALFEKAYGISDVRTKALFCTTDYHTAVNYGDAIISVYPLKESKLAYAPHCSDSGSIVSSIFFYFWERLVNEFKTDSYVLGTTLANGKNGCPFLESQDPTNCSAQLNQFIASLDEYVPGSSARMLAVFNDMLPMVEKYVLIPATEINTIPDGVEVMIVESPYFYAERFTPSQDDASSRYDDDGIPL